MSSVVSPIERAVQDERLRQTRAVFFANSRAFDDGLIARAAISALRDASPEVLGPLADLIVQAQIDERSARARGDATSSVDRHAIMIVDTWNAIVDAALASLGQSDPGQNDAGQDYGGQDYAGPDYAGKTKPGKATGSAPPASPARAANPKAATPPIRTEGV